MEAIAKMAPDVTNSESKAGFILWVLRFWLKPFTTASGSGLFRTEALCGSQLALDLLQRHSLGFRDH